MLNVCEICGTNRDLDRHHVVAKGLGGSSDPAIHGEANLMTLCRPCHRKIHDGRWRLRRTPEGMQLLCPQTGELIMRRISDPHLDTSRLLHLLNLAEDSLSCLLQGLPYLSDDQLVEAYSRVGSCGKRSWVVQAAILYEAQQRSIYGENTLEAIAHRFEIGLRQAQKYALVWKTFFAGMEQEKTSIIDVFSLEESSWYVLASTETKEPEKWLAYAQDRKAEDPRYSVVAFRRDIEAARLTQGIDDIKGMREPDYLLPQRDSWACPWVRLLCVRTGKPVPYRDCQGCEFQELSFSETKPNPVGA